MVKRLYSGCNPSNLQSVYLFYGVLFCLLDTLAEDLVHCSSLNFHLHPDGIYLNISSPISSQKLQNWISKCSLDICTQIDLYRHLKPNLFIAFLFFVFSYFKASCVHYLNWCTNGHLSRLANSMGSSLCLSL